MASETHCKNCGAVGEQQWRARCDGCGKLIAEGPGTPDRIGVQIESRGGGSHSAGDRENTMDYCAECSAKARAALPVWKCALCTHPRHMHNKACMVLGGKLPNGARECCACEGFVEPQPGIPEEFLKAAKAAPSIMDVLEDPNGPAAKPLFPGLLTKDPVCTCAKGTWNPLAPFSHQDDCPLAKASV